MKIDLFGCYATGDISATPRTFISNVGGEEKSEDLVVMNPKA